MSDPFRNDLNGQAEGSSHPLNALFARLAHGVYPPADGVTELMPRTAGAVAAVLAFTGQCVVAADIDPAWVAAACPPWRLSAAYSPAFLSTLAKRTGGRPQALDVLLGAPAEDKPPAVALSPTRDLDEHPRVARSYRMRAEVSVYQMEDSAGILTLGRGLAGRWEAGFEVAEGARNRGLGRHLAAAARCLIPAGEYLFLQVAPGNAASLRAVLAAGFIPLGSELLFVAG
jgi:ribosomal protein S18 acetylase RimI-like enzyme